MPEKLLSFFDADPKRVSDLPTATLVEGTDVVMLVSGGETVKTTVNDLLTFLNATDVDALSASSALALADFVPVSQSGTEKKATVQKVLDSINVAASAGALAKANVIAVVQSGVAKKVAIDNFCGYELSATKAAISATDDRPRIIEVTTDESNGNAKTIYFANGTATPIKLSA